MQEEVVTDLMSQNCHPCVWIRLLKEVRVPVERRRADGSCLKTAGPLEVQSAEKRPKETCSLFEEQVAFGFLIEPIHCVFDQSGF
jgi:hypothetical protein